MPFIQHNAKAIAAFITYLIVTPLTFLGISPETPLETVILILVNAAILYAGVWFSPANK